MDCDVTHNRVGTPTPIIVYAAGMVLGALMCFGGFQLSRSMRFLFGLCFGCYTVGMCLSSSLSIPTYVLGVVSLVAGLVLGTLIKTRYRLGIVLMGFCFGLSAAYMLELLVLVEAWCTSHYRIHLFYGVLLVSALSSAALNIRISSKRLRRHVIIWNSAFAGAVAFLFSMDAFVGDYWTVHTTARCACHVVGLNARLMCLGAVVLCVIGLGVQYVVWYCGRSQRHDQNRTIQLYSLDAETTGDTKKIPKMFKVYYSKERKDSKA